MNIEISNKGTKSRLELYLERFLGKKRTCEFIKECVYEV